MDNTRTVVSCLLLVIANISVLNALSPILLVPGFGGSRLQANIADPSEDCDTGGKWVTFWSSTDQSVKCINKVLTLKYDSQTTSYANFPGVQVRVPGFGDTNTVEFLDDNENEDSAYFHTFVNYFEGKGYVKRKTIRAAPYDWRLGANGLEKAGYYKAVKNLIEEMYEENDQQKVTVVVHSMGGPVTLYLLNNVTTQEWKDKYINTFIPLAGAWSGGNSGLLTKISAMLVGPGAEYLEDFRTSFQTMESLTWLIPNPLVWKDRVLVTTTNHNYSANEYEQLFDSINRQTDYNEIKQAFRNNGNLSAPNVSVHCFYGIGTPTVEIINYGSGLPTSYDSVTYGDGDAAVNLLSSQVCEQWSNQEAPFHVTIFENINHNEIVTATSSLDAVALAIEQSMSRKQDQEFCFSRDCDEDNL